MAMTKRAVLWSAVLVLLLLFGAEVGFYVARAERGPRESHKLRNSP